MTINQKSIKHSTHARDHTHTNTQRDRHRLDIRITNGPNINDSIVKVVKNTLETKINSVSQKETASFSNTKVSV